MKTQIEELIFSMVDTKHNTVTKMNKSFYIDLGDIVNSLEDMARYVEDGVYNMTADEIIAESESFDPRV